MVSVNKKDEVAEKNHKTGQDAMLP